MANPRHGLGVTIGEAMVLDSPRPGLTLGDSGLRPSEVLKLLHRCSSFPKDSRHEDNWYKYHSISTRRQSWNASWNAPSLTFFCVGSVRLGAIC